MERPPRVARNTQLAGRGANGGSERCRSGVRWIQNEHHRLVDRAPARHPLHKARNGQLGHALDDVAASLSGPISETRRVQLTKPARRNLGQCGPFGSDDNALQTPVRNRTQDEHRHLLELASGRRLGDAQTIGEFKQAIGRARAIKPPDARFSARRRREGVPNLVSRAIPRSCEFVEIGIEQGVWLHSRCRSNGSEVG